MQKISNLQLIIASIVLLTAYGLSQAAYGQTTGGVKGRVRNMNGSGIANATITARQNDKDIRTVKANRKGDFVLSGLADGFYNIVFDARGYSAGIKYDVEVKKGKIRDLGDRLILLVDRGTQVIINGSVFYKEGTSVTGAKIEVERLNSSGTAKKLGTLFTSVSGEFTFRQPEGAATYRITATHKGVSASKVIEVDSAAVYRLAITLDLARSEN